MTRVKRVPRCGLQEGARTPRGPCLRTDTHGSVWATATRWATCTHDRAVGGTCAPTFPTPLRAAVLGGPRAQTSSAPLRSTQVPARPCSAFPPSDVSRIFIRDGGSCLCDLGGLQLLLFLTQQLRSCQGRGFPPPRGSACLTWTSFPCPSVTSPPRTPPWWPVVCTCIFGGCQVPSPCALSAPRKRDAGSAHWAQPKYQQKQRPCPHRVTGREILNGGEAELQELSGPIAALSGGAMPPPHG